MSPILGVLLGGSFTGALSYKYPWTGIGGNVGVNSDADRATKISSMIGGILIGAFIGAFVAPSMRYHLHAVIGAGVAIAIGTLSAIVLGHTRIDGYYFQNRRDLFSHWITIISISSVIGAVVGACVPG